MDMPLLKESDSCLICKRWLEGERNRTNNFVTLEHLGKLMNRGYCDSPKCETFVIVNKAKGEL